MSSLPSDKDGRVEQYEANWIRPTCKAFFISWKRYCFLVLWLDRRAELEKSNYGIGCCQNYSQNIGHTVEIVKRMSKVLTLI